jgi:hypothetical protein
MRSFGFVSLCLLTALLVGAVSAESASAHEFVASKQGTTKDHGIGTQTFLGVECTSETSKGKVHAGSSKTIVEKVKYSGCPTFGLNGEPISEVEYEVSAEGSLSILNTVTVERLGCTITVEPAKNKGLKSVTYADESGRLRLDAAVKGITYTSSGGMCGSSGENGEYSGTSEIELVGGTLEWK